MNNLLNDLTINGYVRLPFVIPGRDLSQLENIHSDEGQETNALSFVPEILEAIAQVLGKNAICYQHGYIVQKKSDGLWRQTRDIPVEAVKTLPPGFGPIRFRDGYASITAPDAFLAGLLHIDIYFQEAELKTGALQILPGAHRQGRLPEQTLQSYIAESEEIAYVPAQMGEVHLFRPLMLRRRLPIEDGSLDNQKPLAVRYSLAPKPNLPSPLKFAFAQQILFGVNPEPNRP